jgi:hypothetical protein
MSKPIPIGENWLSSGLAIALVTILFVLLFVVGLWSYVSNIICSATSFMRPYNIY